MFLPIQALGPVMNGNYDLLIFSLSPEIHRSGSNLVGFSNVFGSTYKVYVGTETVASSSIN